MKKCIRMCVWESNSSMTNAISILSEKEYKDWESGKYYVYLDSSYKFEFGHYYQGERIRPQEGKLYSKEEALKYYKISRDYEESRLAEEDISDEDLDWNLSYIGFYSYDTIGDDVDITPPSNNYKICRTYYQG